VQICPTVAPAKIAPGVQGGSGSSPRTWHPLNFVRCPSAAARAVAARLLWAAGSLLGGDAVPVLATAATVSLGALGLLLTVSPQPTTISAVAITATATGKNRCLGASIIGT